MARYLVTGCAGFIGSHLTDALLRAGHVVVGVDSFDGYYPRVLKEANLHGALGQDAFTLVEADILDMDFDGEGTVSQWSLRDCWRVLTASTTSQPKLGYGGVGAAHSRHTRGTTFWPRSDSSRRACKREPRNSCTPPRPRSTETKSRSPCTRRWSRDHCITLRCHQTRGGASLRSVPREPRARRCLASVLQCLRTQATPRHGL